MLRAKTVKYLYSFVFITMVMIILIFFDKYEPSTALNNAISRVTMIVTWPVRSVCNMTESAYNEAKNYMWVYQQNKTLRHQLIDGAIIKQELYLLQQENQLLRQQLKIEQNPDTGFITAKVHNLGSNLFADTIIIKARGLRKNQAVIDTYGLLGRVYKVIDDRAKVLTINDINSRIPVIIKGKDIKMICNGSNSTKLLLIYSHEGNTKIIEKGDEVISSGDCGIFPAGLLIGKVDYINQKGIPVIIRPIRSRTLNLVRVLKEKY